MLLLPGGPAINKGILLYIETNMTKIFSIKAEFLPISLGGLMQFKI